MQVVSLPAERAMRAMNAAMELFVVEYSVLENAVMIRTLENVVKDNIKNVKKALSKDYLPVAFFASRQDADRFHAHLNLILVEEGQLPFDQRNWQRIGELLEQALPPRVRLAD
jgi:hypothetical protein